jgi:hypothetical protein
MFLESLETHRMLSSGGTDPNTPTLINPLDQSQGSVLYPIVSSTAPSLPTLYVPTVKAPPPAVAASPVTLKIPSLIVSTAPSASTLLKQ